MSLEKLSEHFTHYTVEQTWGVGNEPTQEKAINYLYAANPYEYQVRGKRNEDLALVQEIPHSGKIAFWLKNYYLSGMRRVDLHVMDTDKKLIFSIESPGALFQYKAKIFDAKEHPLGTIKKVFNPFIKTYHLRARNSRSLLTIRAPLFKPWTFPIYNSRQKEVGKITKKTPSLGQFMTHRETLEAKCSSMTSLEERCLILSATLLISIDHFSH